MVIFLLGFNPVVFFQRLAMLVRDTKVERFEESASSLSW